MTSAIGWRNEFHLANTSSVYIERFLHAIWPMKVCNMWVARILLRKEEQEDRREVLSIIWRLLGNRVGDVVHLNPVFSSLPPRGSNTHKRRCGRSFVPFSLLVALDTRQHDAIRATVCDTLRIFSTGREYRRWRQSHHVFDVCVGSWFVRVC